MDVLQLHLLLNYYPAIGFVIGLLILGVGMRGRSPGAIRTALRLFIAMAVLTVAVAFTGEFAGRADKGPPGPRADALESHKITATAAFAVTLLAGIVSAVALARLRKAPAGSIALNAAAAALALIAAAILIFAILKGRQVKWAALGPVPSERSTAFFEMEKKLWHA